MSDSYRDVPEVDGALFNDNTNRFPCEELAKYAGQYVAWNLDGTEILAGGATREAAEKKLAERGIHPSRVVWDYVPGPDEDTLL